MNRVCRVMFDMTSGWKTLVSTVDIIGINAQDITHVDRTDTVIRLMGRRKKTPRRIVWQNGRSCCFKGFRIGIRDVG